MDMRKYSKTRINTIVILGFIALLLISCSENFFEKQADNKITPEQHYQTLTDVNVACEGAYSLMQEAMVNLVVVDRLLSDIMETTDWAPTVMNEINYHEISADNPFIDHSVFIKL